MLTSTCYDTDLPLTRYLFFSFWFSLYVVRCYTRAYIYLQVHLLTFYSLLSLPAFHSIFSPFISSFTYIQIKDIGIYPIAP